MFIVIKMGATCFKNCLKLFFNSLLDYLSVRPSVSLVLLLNAFCIEFCLKHSNGNCVLQIRQHVLLSIVISILIIIDILMFIYYYFYIFSILFPIVFIFQFNSTLFFVLINCKH